MWVPTALLPRYGVTWTAVDDSRIRASYRLDDTALDLRMEVDSEGQLVSVVFDRWGDPDNTGTWGVYPFGFLAEGHTSFGGGVTIPTAGRAGWYFDTDRWPTGEFFRFQITDYRLLPA